MNNKEITTNLKSKNASVILETLKYISKEGNKDILDEIIELLVTTKDTVIRDEIIKILENLKDQDCVPYIIKAIENPRFKDILPILVSSSWKNRLDFSDQAEVFTEVFIKSDFHLAFDAFTVLDNLEFIAPHIAKTCLLRLENAVEDIIDDKKPLYFEIINIIEQKKENPAE